MGQFFSWVKSNEKELLVILEGLAKKSVEASEAVYELLQDPTNKEKIKHVSEIETEADVLTRDIFSELNKTFITPLDREDMQRVASKIDDIIDFMDGIAARFASYKITTAPPHTLEMAKELVNATKEVEYMVSKLGNVKNPKSMIEHCRNTSTIEHTIDDLYRDAISELFESNDAIQIIKLKDIYETMETASDRCVDVADVIEDIVLKYT
jgi:predicted phosphate transport protein (TIGR00153 family)